MEHSLRMTPVWLGLALAAAVYAFAFVGPLPYARWHALAAGVVLLAAYALWFGRPHKKVLLFTPIHVVYGALGAAAAYGLIAFGAYFMNKVLVYAEGDVGKAYALLTGYDRATLSVLLGVAAVAEELFWRGFVQRMMSRRWGYGEGFWNATFAYSAVHTFAWNISVIAGALAAGVVWGLLFRWTRRVWPCVVAHLIASELMFVWLPVR